MWKPKLTISGAELIVPRPELIIYEAKLTVSEAKTVISEPHLILGVTNIISWHSCRAKPASKAAAKFYFQEVSRLSVGAEPRKAPITAAMGFNYCVVGSACTPKFSRAVAPSQVRLLD